MPLLEFDHQQIFGVATRMVGPANRHRAMRHNVPGVAGYRLYDLSIEAKVWRCEGTLVAPTLGALIDDVEWGGSYVDASLYDFNDSDGNLYLFCELNDYGPIGNYQRGAVNGVDSFFVRVGGTVIQAYP